MGDYRDYVGGSYLKAEDFVGRRVRVEVETVGPEQIKNGDQTDTKLVARFVGKEKGLVLNKTNLDTLCMLTNSTDFEQWSGVMVEMYHDPTVKMGTKTVGGLRLRGTDNGRPAPQPAAPARPAQVAPPPSGMIVNDPAEEAALATQVYDDDIPF